MRSMNQLLAIGLMLMLLGSTSGYGQLTPTKIVDTNTSIPNGSGNFTFFSQPSISTMGITFGASGNSGQLGVYFRAAGGALNRVADLNTALPGGTGNFTAFDFNTSFALPQPVISTSTVAFDAAGSTGQYGLYTFPSTGGVGTRIANTSTPVPSGTGNFNAFFDPTLSGNRLVAFGLANANSGLYSFPITGGTGIRVAVAGMAAPGGSTFSGIASQVIYGGPTNVVFLASLADGKNGIFSYDPNGGINNFRICDTSTSVPGGTGAFISFGNTTPVSRLDTGNGLVAVVADGTSNQQGLYLFPQTGGPGIVVADKSTTIPGTNATFTLFQYPSIGQDFLVFDGGDTINRALFLYSNGILSRLISAGDSIDGKTVRSALVAPNAIDGTDLAVNVYFTDNSQGIYLVSVPEPGTIALCCTLILLSFAIFYWIKRNRLQIENTILAQGD